MTAIDCAIPMVLMRAADLGLTGYEDPQALTANSDLIERMTRIRIQAGKLMGMGDVTDMVIQSRYSSRQPAGAALFRCDISCRMNVIPHWRQPAPSASRPQP